MKLQIKLVLYNAVSKALIISALAVIIPMMIQKIVYNHIDNRLNARQEKMIRMIQLGGLNEITLDQDCSFDSYNIFKEEYVSISPLASMPADFGKTKIVDSQRIVDNQLLKHRVLTQAFLYDNQLYKIEIGEGLSSAVELDSAIRRFTLKVMIGIVLFSIFIDLGFAQVLLRPFYKVVNEKLRDAEHPTTFNFKTVKTNTYEFAYLDRSINEMMTKIREAFQLEREFITNVSHELLTPISILQNRVENMINDPGIPDDTVNKLAESQKTLSRLSRVIKALLYISRIENQQYVKNETAELDVIIRDVLEETEVLIQDKNIALVIEQLDSFIFQPCNKSLLHTLVFNLISNAIKYNVREGKITIEGRRTDGGFRLRISDTGIGIPPEQLPFVFDRFKRLRPEDEIGYGLGLPIVRSIAAFHHIEIKAESEVDKGTSFYLFFPEGRLTA